MAFFPDRDSFERAYDKGHNQIVWTTIAADLDTPVSLMLKLSGAGRDSFLLESVTGGESRGRYSIIGLKPDLIWECRGDAARVNRSARFDADAFEADGTTLASLRGLIEESRIELPEGLPPMAAGLFGYLGYDMIRLVERLPGGNPDPLDLPDAMMMRPTIVVVLDGVRSEITICAPVWSGSGMPARAAYAQAAERVMDAIGDLDRQPPPDTRDVKSGSGIGTPKSNIARADYLDMVDTARDHIARGDIFQVVPSQRWAVPFELPPFALYRALRRTNPSPYMFFFNFGGLQVIGASPEILVKTEGRKVTIRPIAGTRKRGATPAEDLALEEELLADPKEMAEHLMLLDLGRNDVGRVSKVGTVTPTEQFTIERYSHVMHIVSNVEGMLRDDHDALSALLAGLPAGTVSGAPKIRAMEIIDALEPEKRGLYGGGVGYFSAGGDMDMCIALRTGLIKDETLYVQAGGGVVWDSDPEAEFEETVNKARALMSAAEEAGRFVRWRGGQSAPEPTPQKGGGSRFW